MMSWQSPEVRSIVRVEPRTFSPKEVWCYLGVATTTETGEGTRPNGSDRDKRQCGLSYLESASMSYD